MAGGGWEEDTNRKSVSFGFLLCSYVEMSREGVSRVSYEHLFHPLCGGRWAPPALYMPVFLRSAGHLATLMQQPGSVY